MRRCETPALALAEELSAASGSALVAWSQHLKHDQPTFSPTFLQIVAALELEFDVDVYASRQRAPRRHSFNDTETCCVELLRLRERLRFGCFRSQPWF